MWREKLRALRAKPQVPPLLFVFWPADPAPPEHIADVRSRASFVSESYLDFLRLTDGAQLDFFVLYGSGQSQFRSLTEANESWSSIIDSSKSLVIGEDAGGNVFVLDEDGAIRRVSSDPPGRSEIVAISFDELLDLCFMGPRYVDLIGTIAPNNHWWEVLRENKWV